MTLAVKWATDAMGPEVLKEVTEFFRKAKVEKTVIINCNLIVLFLYLFAFYPLNPAPYRCNLI